MAAIWEQKHNMRVRIRELMEKRLEKALPELVMRVALELADLLVIRMTLAEQKEWAVKLTKDMAKVEPT